MVFNLQCLGRPQPSDSSHEGNLDFFQRLLQLNSTSRYEQNRETYVMAFRNSRREMECFSKPLPEPPWIATRGVLVLVDSAWKAEEPGGDLLPFVRSYRFGSGLGWRHFGSVSPFSDTLQAELPPPKSFAGTTRG